MDKERGKSREPLIQIIQPLIQIGGPLIRIAAIAGCLHFTAAPRLIVQIL